MKKLFLPLLLLAFALNVNAWIFPDDYTTQKVSAHLADMKFAHVSEQKTSYKKGYALYSDDHEIIASSGTAFLLLKQDGLFVGQYKPQNTDNIKRCDAVFSAGKRFGYPLKSIKITYYKLNQDNGYTYYINGCKHRSTQSAIYDGRIYYTNTYDFEVPSTSFMISRKQEGEWDTTSGFAKDLGYSARGVVITDVEIEYVDNLGDPINHLADTYKNMAERLDRNYLIEETQINDKASSDVRNNALLNGDVNLDGAVNSADVVTIYNNITNGSNPTMSGEPYVDLGLPSGILWATCNLGANTPEGCGDYFAWAEANSLYDNKCSFTADNYKPIIPTTEYKSSYEETFPKGSFPPSGQPYYGECSWHGWYIPSFDDYEELLSNCTKEVRTINDVEGLLLTSKKNNNTIFFPFSGYIEGSELKSPLSGTYWINNAKSKDNASIFYFPSSGNAVVTSGKRYIGRPIRCVIKPAILKP